MRTRRLLLAAAALAAMLLPAMSNAGPTCVSYTETLPVVGKKTVSQCAPGLFNQGITIYNCSGTPPVGESHCVSVTVYLP